MHSFNAVKVNSPVARKAKATVPVTDSRAHGGSMRTMTDPYRGGKAAARPKTTTR